MTFLNPLDALIPKIAFSFFPDFWVWVTSEAWGSDSVGFWGSCQLSSFWGRGGVRPEGSIDPPPPKRNPASPDTVFGPVHPHSVGTHPTWGAVPLRFLWTCAHWVMDGQVQWPLRGGGLG